MLNITLFGPFRIAVEANPEIKLTGTSKRLFAYLLLQNYRPQPRELLADLFWGEQGEDRAHKCLNTALWRLRSALEHQGVPQDSYLVTTDADQIAFNRYSQHWLDLAIFEDKVRRLLNTPVEAMSTAQAGEFEAIQQLYRGDLLEGFYDDWALRAREHMRILYLDCLALYMRYDQQNGHPELAVKKGQMILELDPLREEIHREMMRLYLAIGQRPLAIRQYINCAGLLERELGIQPMPETQQLYHLCLDDAHPLHSATHLVTQCAPVTQADLDSVYSQLENLTHTLTSAQENFTTHLASAQEQLRQVKRQVERLSSTAEIPR